MPTVPTMPTMPTVPTVLAALAVLMVVAGQEDSLAMESAHQDLSTFMARAGEVLGGQGGLGGQFGSRIGGWGANNTRGAGPGELAGASSAK